MIIFSSSLWSLLSVHAQLSYEELLSLDRAALRQMRNQGCPEEYIEGLLGDNYETLIQKEAHKMRWKAPVDRDIRYTLKFLWWPRSWDGETRWLEYALIKERYLENHGWWLEVGWGDNEDKEE